MPAEHQPQSRRKIATIRLLSATAVAQGLASPLCADERTAPMSEPYVASKLSTSRTEGTSEASRLAERQRRLGDLQIRLADALQAKAALERRESVRHVAARMTATPDFAATDKPDEPPAQVARLSERVAARDRAFAALAERAQTLRIGLDDAERLMARLRDDLDATRREAVDLRAERDRLQATLAADQIAALPEQKLRDDLADVHARLEAMTRERDVLVAAQAAFETAEMTRTPALASARAASVDPALAAKLRSSADASRPIQLASLETTAPKPKTRGELRASTDRIDFAKNSAVLQTGGEAAVAELVAFVLKHPDRPIVIRGHTDSIGDPEYNRRLSARRAETIKTILVDHHGIDRARVSVEGMGASQPIASNELAAGRRSNRRVEVVLPEVVPPPG